MATSGKGVYMNIYLAEYETEQTFFAGNSVPPTMAERITRYNYKPQEVPDGIQ